METWILQKSDSKNNPSYSIKSGRDFYVLPRKTPGAIFYEIVPYAVIGPIAA